MTSLLMSYPCIVSWIVSELKDTPIFQSEYNGQEGTSRPSNSLPVIFLQNRLSVYPPGMLFYSLFVILDSRELLLLVRKALLFTFLTIKPKPRTQPESSGTSNRE